MLDHHLQRDIVHTLASTESLRFSELKPGDIENKLFDYHLKKTIRAGFVEKNADGSYQLTAEGRKIGKSAYSSDKRLINRAYSVLFLAVKRPSDNAWLLYKRPTHPLFGLIGLPHAQPEGDKSIFESAAETLRSETTLNGTFTPSGSGFFRIFDGDDLESFINFTLLECHDPSGELVGDDYFWELEPDWQSKTMTPTMPALISLINDPSLTFIEQTIKD